MVTKMSFLKKCWWQIALVISVLSPLTSVTAGVNVLTYHNDMARTGQNTNETILTPANVTPATFTRLFTAPVDGYVYAQPLVVTNVAIPNQGAHDVVYVATEHDSVYAFDANTSGLPLWQVSFINPDAGITTVTSADVNCNDLVPEIGITSTPVIDAASGTIYVSAKTKEVVGGVTNYFHRLHALDIGTGAEKFGGPAVVTAIVSGTGDGNDGAGHVPFDPFTQFNRAALLLNKGVVYIASASHCDNGSYHGWLIGYGAQTLTLSNVFNTTPNGGLGGIWGGLASDTNGSIYTITGNGTFDPSPSVNCFGDSFIKLSTTNGLKLADYFTPFNQALLSSSDVDLGSGGPLVLPDEVGSPSNRHLIVGAGKEGTIYLVNRDNMQHYNPTNDNLIVQFLTSGIGHNFSTPAYFNKKIYCLGARDKLKAFTITNGLIATPPASQSTNTFGFPGATPSISANGTNNGIVWVLQTDASKSNGPAVLRAYDAGNVATELYNSSASGGPDYPGIAVKFAVPTVANGKVFVGARYALSVYGLAASLATPVIVPAGGVFANAANVTITDTSAGVSIYYTLDGSIPTTNATLYTGQFILTNSTLIQARAFKTGAFDSDIAAANITVYLPDITPPTCTITVPSYDQSWSNNVLFVTGQAADNTGVASVFYNLNNTGWNPANTSDGWSSWTAQVVLTSGNNFISTYAADAAGNYSATNNVSFTCVLAAPLNINIVGLGQITGATNRQLFDIGQTVTLATTPGAGYVLANWLVEVGGATVLSTSLATPFVMQSNLVLTASFADVAKPALTITTQLSNQLWSNEVFTVTGQVTDNGPGGVVWVQLNGGGWSLANGWSNWTANATLAPGTNILSIYAADTAGNLSVTDAVTLIHIASGVMSVNTNGLGGSIAPDLNNAVLLIGASYAMTAVPKPGYVFANWTDGSGDHVTNKPTVKFTMSPHLALTANFVDITKPTVTITNLPATGAVSNELFTIKGTASDNASLVGVFYNLNHTGWSNSVSANNWTNWAGILDLAPGTNSISIYSQDVSGNCSLTNNARLFYVLSGLLTVRTNGNGGSIVPNYNQALLQIGLSYTMTAVAKPGFAFTNWTDGSDGLVTNKPAVRFTMVSNLILTANFLDIVKPTISATNLPVSGIVSNQSFTLKGRAGDNVSVANAFYNLTGGGWGPVSSENNWTNWSALLDLKPGTNTIYLLAMDTAGNYSVASSVRLIYVVSDVLTLHTTGNGSIVPADNGALLQIGRPLTLTAIPGTGFVFTNWTAFDGTILTNKPALKFVMASNLVLTANFKDVSKPLISIVTPTASTVAVGEFYKASGKAADNAGLAAVRYKINSGGWYLASTNNQWTNWTVTVGLTPGTNYFSAYAVDTSGNQSVTGMVKFIYNTAPATLSGLKAAVTPDGGSSSFDLAFGVGTFSQESADPANGNGSGTYTYTKLSPNAGQLKANFTTPPRATTTPAYAKRPFSLYFSAPGVARYLNTNNDSSGGIIFTSTPTLAPSVLFNQTVVFVADQGDSESTRFVGYQSVDSDFFTHVTNSPKTYTYAPYSPLGAVMKQTGTNGVTYTVLSFRGTNNGVTYLEKYGTAGSFIGTNRGNFGFVSQQPGGNAPTNLVNRSALVSSVGDSFRLLFGPGSFTQTNPVNDFNIQGFGSYTYVRAGTNAGNLYLNFTAPPSNSSALFQFPAPNFAVFTNTDSTAGSAVFK